MTIAFKNTAFSFAVIFCALPFAWAEECKIPDTLEGKTLLLRPSEAYSPNNPNAGQLMKLVFGQDRKYKNVYLTTDKSYQGTFEYKKDFEGVAHYIGEENFEGETTKYEIWFFCENNVSGRYVYRQQQGATAPDTRANNGLYSIDRH